MKKTILITGATGFLGGRTAEKLSADPNYHIIATGRNKEKGKRLQQTYAIDFIPCDLSVKEAVNELLKDVDITIHTAALSSLWGKYSDYNKANILATKHIVDASIRNSVEQLIHISTPSIYPQRLGEDFFDIKETFVPKSFISTYAETKYKAEQIVTAAQKNGLPSILLRPRALYGRGDLTIMPRILRSYHAGSLKIIGKGDNIVDASNINNVIHAIECSLFPSVQANNQIYNISDGVPYKMWEMVKQVLAALDLPWEPTSIPYPIVDKVAWAMESWAKLSMAKKEPMITRASVSIAACSATLNIEKAKNLLGYQPTHTLTEGIHEFAQWWKTR